MQRMIVNDHPVRAESLGVHYGFTRNPYDPSPLAGDATDSELFVGRERESSVFRTFLGSFDRGGVVVEGGTGVGKTSFANVQEYRANLGPGSLHLVSTRQPIQLAATLGPVEFMLSVLSNVLNSLQLSRPQASRRAAFRKLTTAVQQTILKSGGWNVSAMGYGAGVASQSSVSNPLLVLMPTVSSYLDEAAQLAAEFGIRRLVVNVNNLDVVPPRDLIAFLDASRDLTLIRPGYLWVFLGPVGARALVAQQSRRVSELLRTDPVWLAPLSLKDVRAAIEARVRRFRAAPGTSAPVSDDVIRLLYESSAGEVRYILNRSTDLLLRTMAEYPTSRQISLDLARPMLRQMTREAIGRLNLTTKQRAVLERLARSGPCQPRDFAAFGFSSAPAFLRYLARFYELGLADRRRREDSVVYTPRGDVVLALETPDGSVSGKGT